MSYCIKIYARISCKYILIVSLTSVIIRQRHHSQSLSRMSRRLKHAYVLKDNYLKSDVSTHSLLHLSTERLWGKDKCTATALSNSVIIVLLMCSNTDISAGDRVTSLISARSIIIHQTELIQLL